MIDEKQKKKLIALADRLVLMSKALTSEQTNEAIYWANEFAPLADYVIESLVNSVGVALDTFTSNWTCPAGVTAVDVVVAVNPSGPLVVGAFSQQIMDKVNAQLVLTREAASLEAIAQ